MTMIFNASKRTREPNSAVLLPSDSMISELVGYERRARTVRGEMFQDHAINDASWPLLQDLFKAHLRGQKVRTKELCATSGLPQTTVLRYLDHLEKFEVVTRESDPDDHRVTLVSVTEAGAFGVREYYTHLIQSERRLAESGGGLFSLNESEIQRDDE